MYLYLFIYIFVHIYMDIHIYIYVHIYIYTCVPILVCLFLGTYPFHALQLNYYMQPMFPLFSIETCYSAISDYSQLVYATHKPTCLLI